MSLEYTEFRHALEEVDGNLLPVACPDAAEEKLYLTTRHVLNPVNEPNPGADIAYHGWYADAMDSAFVVDIYAETDNVLTPVGHLDWEITDGSADGSCNTHDAFLSRTSCEQRAARQFGGFNHAFVVTEAYQRRSLGTLMLATSGVVLPSLGVRDFYSGFLLDHGAKTYRRFDIDANEFAGEGTDRLLPIERLLEHPKVEATITRFLPGT